MKTCDLSGLSAICMLGLMLDRVYTAVIWLAVLVVLCCIFGVAFEGWH